MALVGDVVSGSSGETRACDGKGHTAWTFERLIGFAVDPTQGVQDRFLGAYRQTSTTRHPVLTQWYGPSGECRIAARDTLAQSKIHQEQLPAVQDILTVEAGARYC